MTTIVLRHFQWNKIRSEIDQTYGKSVGMVSWKLKETLGFTVRHHKGFDTRIKEYVDDIRLDFVNEDAATFFRMKYL